MSLVSDLLRLLFPGVSGQGCSQLLELQHSSLLPIPKGLHPHGDKDHVCQPAPFPMLGHLLIEPDSEGMPSPGGSPVDMENKIDKEYEDESINSNTNLVYGTNVIAQSCCPFGL